MLFENKVVLITGAASGIGRMCALAFAREGAAILISDVNDEGGRATAALVEKAGGKAHYLHADVSRADEVETMVAAAVAQFGGLHVAVNNAGVAGTHMNLIPDTDEFTYEKVMNINVKGVWLCLRAEIPAILRSGGGAIVNMASVAGLIGSPGAAIYAASKHAVIGLTKTAALEYARENLRVNAVCPSYIDTPMVTNIAETDDNMARMVQRTSPMKRLGRPEEVAEMVLWLCSEKASFVNAASIPIDGGFTAS